MRSLFEFVGIGKLFSGNSSFNLDKDGVHPDDKGTRNLVRIMHGRIPKSKKKNDREASSEVNWYLKLFCNQLLKHFFVTVRVLLIAETLFCY